MGKGRAYMKLTINEFKPNDIIKINNEDIRILDIKDEIYLVECNDSEYKFNKIDLFKFLMDKEQCILTHNCSERIVCGRLNSIASMMSLGNTQACSIRSHDGAGMVASIGKIQNIQYYYASMDWIKNWFKERGLDANGYDQDINDDQTINYEKELSGEEQVEIKETKTDFHFNGEHKEIDETKDQHFTEV
jgi:hypothetical protein